jgi:hypothetical protein
LRSPITEGSLLESLFQKLRAKLDAAIKRLQDERQGEGGRATKAGGGSQGSQQGGGGVVVGDVGCQQGGVSSGRADSGAGGGVHGGSEQRPVVVDLEEPTAAVQTTPGIPQSDNNRAGVNVVPGQLPGTPSGADGPVHTRSGPQVGDSLPAVQRSTPAITAIVTGVATGPAPAVAQSDSWHQAAPPGGQQTARMMTSQTQTGGQSPSAQNPPDVAPQANVTNGVQRQRANGGALSLQQQQGLWGAGSGVGSQQSASAGPVITVPAPTVAQKQQAIQRLRAAIQMKERELVQLRHLYET